MFCSCEKLAEVTVPEGVRRIGKLTVADVAMIYAHIRSTQATEALTDLTGDGKITVADVARLYILVRS